MNRFFYLFFLFSFPLFALTNVEQEHRMAEFWQQADSKYCLRILNEDFYPEHLFIIDSISHSNACECGMKMYESSEDIGEELDDGYPIDHPLHLMVD